MSGRRATPHELRVSEREYALAKGQRGDQAMSHTPGPWEVNGRAIETAAKPHIVIAYAEDDEDYAGASEWRANARLIAAAPELLAALRTLVESLEWERKRSGTTYNGFETAQAAIRRAEGRS